MERIVKEIMLYEFNELPKTTQKRVLETYRDFIQEQEIDDASNEMTDDWLNVNPTWENVENLRKAMRAIGVDESLIESRLQNHYRFTDRGVMLDFYGNEIDVD